MSKLFSLKEWLTLDEAANYLTACLQEPVTQADTIRLAIDGHLIMSVNFVNSVYARCGKAIPNSENVVGGIPFNGRDVLMFDDDIVFLSGIYDLPMIGGEIFDCEHKFHKLMGGPLVLRGECRGAFVRSHKTGQYFQIQKYFPDDGEQFDFHKAREQLNKWDWKNRLFDDVVIEHFIEKGGELTLKPSRDDVFVVRTSALRDFIDSMVQPIADKPLTTTERNTLLKLVIGMAIKGYCHDPCAAKSSAAQEIANDLAALGIRIDDGTVRKYLKQAAENVLPTKQRQP